MPEATAQHPVSHPSAPSQPPVGETVAASSPAASRPLMDNSTPTPTETSALPGSGDSDVVSDAMSDAAMNFPATLIPMNYGDMEALGLVSWTPWGIVPWILETIQVSTGLQWWSVIALATIGARLVALPLSISHRRMRERMAPVEPELLQIHREIFRSLHGDDERLDRLIQRQKALWRSCNTNPTLLHSMALGEAAVHLGMFFGILKMCYAPVEQLKVGGLGWITDLTSRDPYTVLPAVVLALLNLQISFNRHSMPATVSRSTPHSTELKRLLTFIVAGVLDFLPAALGIHALCSVAFLSAQTVILRIPALSRRILSSSSRRSHQEAPSTDDTIITVKSWSSRVVGGPTKVEDHERKTSKAQKKQPRA